MIAKMMEKYRDGEILRTTEASLDGETPSPWGRAYAFLIHNGWVDESGCESWPLSRSLWTSYKVWKGNKLIEFDIGLDPWQWVIGPVWFADDHKESNVRQVLFNFGPVSLSAMYTVMKPVGVHRAGPQ